MHASVGDAGHQDGPAHHGLGAVGPGPGQFGGIADELGTGHQRHRILRVARCRGVGICSNEVVGRSEIGCLVPRELDRAAREVDERVAIHLAILVVPITMVTGCNG